MGDKLINKSLKFLLVIFLTLLNIPLYSQSLPLGFPVIEELLRRDQLLGNYDSLTSFCFRPINPKVDFNQFKVNGIFKSLIKSKNKFISFRILAPNIRSEYSGHHPFMSNNGTMIPAKGYQTLAGLGLYSKTGPLEIQLNPEFIYAQNLSFPGFPDSFSDEIWTNYYTWWLNLSDIPERIHKKNYKEIALGQSKVSLGYKNFLIGVSNQNIWWGPGKFHSLIMTNNAPGFSHLFISSKQPINIYIGTLEGQILSGKLEGSNSSLPYPSRYNYNIFHGGLLDDWRYYSAFSFTFRPRGSSNLFFGINRGIQQYWEDVKKNNDYLPILLKFLKAKDGGKEDRTGRDQVASVFLRWLWIKANAEFYFEYGRNDASWNFRDLYMSPQHSRAYVFGFSKLMPISNNSFAEINFEIVEIQQSINYLVRNAGSWYVHTRSRHGLTNKGQVLGSNVGPGGKEIILETNYINNINKFGLRLSRTVHNNDFVYMVFNDVDEKSRNWIDFNIGIHSNYLYKSILFASSMTYIKSLNYQWELLDKQNSLSVQGKDVSNINLMLNITYLF